MESFLKIPEGLLPIVLGVGVWYGVCYLYLAPELTERSIVRQLNGPCRAEFGKPFCECSLDELRGHRGQLESALFLASFGWSDRRPVDMNQHPYVDHLSRRLKAPETRALCTVSEPADVDLIAEKVKEEEAIKFKKIQKLHEQALVKEREANQLLVAEMEQTILDLQTDTKRKIEEIEAAAGKQVEEVIAALSKSPIVQDQIEDAETVYELQNRTRELFLNAWETGIDVGNDAVSNIQEWRWKNGY